MSRIRNFDTPGQHQSVRRKQVVALVGGGLAAVSTANELRDAGFDGKVLLFSDENVAPYDRPPLSKAVLTGELTDCWLRPSSWYDDCDIDLVLGVRVDAIDVRQRRLQLSSGETIRFDHALLATGAKARWPENLDSSSDRVFALRTLSDSLAIRSSLTPGASVAIVGGGFIGAELASSATSLGCRVTMLEAMTAPFERVLGKTVGAMLATFYAEHGVRLLTDVPVRSIVPHGHGVHITTGDGRLWDADVAVLGVGATPNIELAVAAGLPVSDGIEVDARCATPAPCVYAAGDVARRPEPICGGRIRIEHWQNAQSQGLTAARAILGLDGTAAGAPWFWSDQFGRNIQVTGFPNHADKVIAKGHPSEDRFVAFYLKGDRLVAALGIDATRDVHLSRRLIAERRAVDTRVLSGEHTTLSALVEPNTG
ncbi:pyridine nucleotide-disulfide oxidoreductase [Mycobacterium paraintracellulare]|nr:pyridine nucleotide-disulfide oxidoreductase [Mycobacterium paraintracellulare]